jgi:hypothetical protein
MVLSRVGGIKAISEVPGPASTVFIVRRMSIQKVIIVHRLQTTNIRPLLQNYQRSLPHSILRDDYDELLYCDGGGALQSVSFAAVASCHYTKGL